MTDFAETAHKVQAASRRLLAAADDHQPCEPVRDVIGREDVALAYEVQRELSRVRLNRGARVVGHKIGLTSPAVQAQLGVDQPDFGMLYDDMVHVDGSTLDYGDVLQPRAEAEVAFVLADDLDHDHLDLACVRDAIAYSVAAIEICGSRIRDWDISFGDSVADNASAGAFVLGWDRRTLAQFEPSEVEMSMTVNGEVVSAGHGTACLGDPLNAMLWLAREARAFGAPLCAGQVVLSGALGPMWPVAPGAEVAASISGLGQVSVRFGQE